MDVIIIAVGVILLAVVAGLAKAVQDILSHKYSSSVFSNPKIGRYEVNPKFWNPKYSWRNKYKDRIPSLGEKFPFSTTAFVPLTDGWHLTQSVNINALTVACFLSGITGSIILFITAVVIYRGVFEVFYRWILIK